MGRLMPRGVILAAALAGWGARRKLANDEGLDAAERPLALRARPVAEAVGHPGELFELKGSTGRPVGSDEALDHRHTEIRVSRALDDQRRRQLRGLAAIEDPLRIAFVHGLLSEEVLLRTGD